MLNPPVEKPWEKREIGYGGKSAKSNEATGYWSLLRLFSGRTRASQDQVISYIDTDKERFAVEVICRVLRQEDRGFITSRGYRKATTGIPQYESVGR